MSHHMFAKVISLDEGSSDLTLKQLFGNAQQRLGAQDIVIEFSRDIVHKLACPGCGAEEELFAAVGTVPYARGKCAGCGQMRAVITAHSYSGTESYGDRALNQLGLPLFDVFSARSAESEIAYLIAGDKQEVMGQMAMGASH
jgi:hypothetical protein